MKLLLPLLFTLAITEQSLASKVVLVVFENTAASKAEKYPQFGWIATNGSRLANYYAVTHPSQPNYIALMAGDTMGVRNDSIYDISGDHLGDLLEEKGLDWAVYADNYPGNCFTDKRNGAYARRHNPLLSFTNVQQNPNRCAKIKNSANFIRDAKSGALPDFTLFIPDNNNNGHDTGIQYADKWVGSYWIPLLKDPQFLANHTVIFTFDEDDGGERNRVYTSFIGAHVKKGFVSQKNYNHYSMLKTIETLFRLPDLGRNDRTANPIDDIWTP